MILHVENLTKEYKSKITSGFFRDLFLPMYRSIQAVNDISFVINKGETVALLGPNGAGKTTTMKMLSGLVYPTRGEVKVLGFIPFKREKDFLMRIGLVMGNKTGLDWDLTPSQSFQLFKKIYNIKDSVYKERLGILTQMLDVTQSLDVQVRKLSLGERMKMELIGAIIHDPEVLFLDEPTIGLDVISKQRVREFLREIQKKFGVTLLLTSHDMDDVEKVCDRVIVINKGSKVYDDSLESLTKQYNKDRYIKLIFKDMPKEGDLKKRGELVEYGKNYCVYKLHGKELGSLIGKITDDYELVDIEILSVPLDEIIADIYNGSAK